MSLLFTACRLFILCVFTQNLVVCDAQHSNFFQDLINTGDYKTDLLNPHPLLVWVDNSNFERRAPDNAIVGGYHDDANNREMFIVRGMGSQNRRHLTVGKGTIHDGYFVADLPHSKEGKSRELWGEYRTNKFQVLCYNGRVTEESLYSTLVWVRVESTTSAPSGAIIGGRDEYNKPVYIARANLRNHLDSGYHINIGKAVINNGELTGYFPYWGMKILNIGFEILCDRPIENVFEENGFSYSYDLFDSLLW